MKKALLRSTRPVSSESPKHTTFRSSHEKTCNHMPQVMVVDDQVKAPFVVVGGGDLSSSWYEIVTIRTANSAIREAVACDGLAAAVVADDLPEVSFAEMVRRLRGLFPTLPIIALTRETKVNTVVDLMRAGASDVIVRPLTELSLVTAISQQFSEKETRVALNENLTSRETSVFSLLGEGYGASSIAKRLGINIKTVDGTFIRLRSKLNCSDVSTLRQLAVSCGRQQAIHTAITMTIPVVGHPDIDSGHCKMLSNLCRLERELTDSDVDFITMVQSVDALLESAHNHDREEVELMSNSQFPGIAEHRAEHTVLLNEILTLKTRVTEGRAVGVNAFRAFVLHWLGEHVQRFDRILMTHLRQVEGWTSSSDMLSCYKPDTVEKEDALDTKVICQPVIDLHTKTTVQEKTKNFQSPEERLLLLDKWKQSGLSAVDFSVIAKVSPQTLSEWKQRFETEGITGLDPKSCFQGKSCHVPEITRRIVVMLKKLHPTWEPKKISDELVRGPGLAASATIIVRILQEEGFACASIASCYAAEFL